MSMSLTQGGHLSHGSPVSFTGRLYRVTSYGVDLETEIIDYGVVGEIARKAKPKVLVCGATAYPRTIDFWAFQEIADEGGGRLHGRYSPYRRSVCNRDARVLSGGRGLHHYHHPQDPAGTPGRCDHV